MALLSDAAGSPCVRQKEGRKRVESATVTFAQQRVHLLLFWDDVRCCSLLYAKETD